MNSRIRSAPISIFLMAAIAAMLPVRGWAADDPATAKPAEKPQPTVKVSGVIYPFWMIDLSEGKDNFNQFGIDRAYFRADAKITDAISARITLDGTRGAVTDITLPDDSTVSVGDARYFVFVKHAWLGWKASDAIDIRAGIIDTPMVPFVEGYQGLRWTGKVLLDDEGLESSADIGVSIAGKHGKGLFSWMAGVYNGEGFSKPEVGSGKSVQARATLDPLAGGGKKISLPISGFIDENVHEGDVDPRTTFAGDVGFKHPNLMASAEVAGFAQGDASGLGESVTLAPGVPDVGYVVARLDHYDPDSGTDQDDLLKVWAGVAHDFYDKVSLGAFFQLTQPAADGAAATPGVYVRAQVGF
jgi:hypothetical protein